MTIIRIEPAYRDAIRVALILQVLCTLFLLTVLDGGVMAKVGGCAMIGFWIGVAVIMLRRPRNPKPLDLLYIRWGYIVMLVVGMVAASVITSIQR